MEKDEVATQIKKLTDMAITNLALNLPASRERSIAITNYEQAMMWALKANEEADTE